MHKHASSTPRRRLRRILVPFLAAVLGFAGALSAPLSASAAGTTYYVDAVAGNDANAGTSTSAPWRTLTKVTATSFSAGDQVLLKGGSTWTGSVTISSSGTSSAPIVLGSYGTGRPRIDTNTAATNAVTIRNAKYVTIQNLEITNSSNYNTSTSSIYRGIYIEAKDFGEVPGIVIQNNYVHNIDGTGKSGGIGNGGIVAGVRGNSTATWYSGLRITGNEVANVRAYGISTFTTWCANCVIYSEETGIPSSELASTRKATTGLVIDSNYVHDVTGGGIVPQYADAALVQYNTVDRAANDQLVAGGGNVGIWWQGTNNITVQYNTVRRTAFGGIYAAADAMAFDADYSTNNSVVQYNISEQNNGGLFMCLAGSYSNDVRYNISYDDRRSIIQNLDGCHDTRVENNTIWTTTTQTPTLTSPGVPGPSKPLNAIVQSDAPGATLVNNIIENPQKAALTGVRNASSPAATFFSHNSYDDGSASPAVGGNDPAPVTAAPQLANPVSSLPANGFITPAVFAAYFAGFTPSTSSPVRNAGVSIPSASVDIRGTKIPVGSPDLGAVQHAVTPALTTSMGTSAGAPANLADGNDASSWASAAGPASGGWVNIAYSDARRIDTVTVAGRFGQGQGPTSVTVQTWNGSAWVTQLTNAPITWNSNTAATEYKRLQLPAAVTTTQLRLVINTWNSTWNIVAFNELSASFAGVASTDMGEFNATRTVATVVDNDRSTPWITPVTFTAGSVLIDTPPVTATKITFQANFGQSQGPTKVSVQARNGDFGAYTTVLPDTTITWTGNTATVESQTLNFTGPITATRYRVIISSANSAFGGMALSGIAIN